MKTIKVYLAAVLIAGLSLTSCSDDDNGSSTGGEIMAKWTPIKTVYKISGQEVTVDYTDNEPTCDKDYIEFATGNVLNDVVYYKDASNVCTADANDPTTYTKADDDLTINGGEYSGTYDITRLNGSELRFSREDNEGGINTVTTYHFSKVN